MEEREILGKVRCSQRYKGFYITNAFDKRLRLRGHSGDFLGCICNLNFSFN